MFEPFGFLNLDKPAGLTSHDVVSKVRRGLKIKKVGHAGTLDPMATGVLVVCLGPATRLSEYVMHTTKQYRARVHLGMETTTYDAEGEITAQADASQITCEQVVEALPQFTGSIEQQPPMYSAIKQGGRKLYELAREGQTVERPARTVRIDVLVLETWEPPEFTLSITCGSGTYVRSLAHDLGQVLGVGAHLNALVRTASGAFRIEDAVKLDEILTDPNWSRSVLPPDAGLQDLPARYLNAEEVDHIAHGRPVEARPDDAGQTLARAYRPDGHLLAILKADDGLWRPHKVFLTAD